MQATLSVLLSGISIFIALLFLHYLAGAENPFRCGLASLGLGGASLLAVNLAGLLTGVTLPLSLLAIGVSLAGGPAGVALLLAVSQWIV